MSGPSGQNNEAGVDGAKLAADIDAQLARFMNDARSRNEDKLTNIFQEIEKVLSVIMQKPFVKSDLHCRNLLAGMARSGDPETFLERASEFDLYVKKLVAATLGEDVSHVSTPNSMAVNRKVDISDRPENLVDEDAEPADRMRLKLT